MAKADRVLAAGRGGAKLQRRTMIKSSAKMTVSVDDDRDAPGRDRSPAGADDPEPGGRPTPASGRDIQLSFDTADTEPPAAGWLERLLGRVIEELGIAQAAVDVVVVDDTAMAALHEEHCDLPGTTDVLTFDLRDDAAAALEGEIIVCKDEAARQARQRGHEVRVELLLYAVHGLLHLLGEDDHDEAGYQRMHQREDALLTAVGVGPVFGEGPMREWEA